MSRLLHTAIATTIGCWTGVYASLGLAQSTPREIVEKSESLRQIENSIQTVKMTLVSKSGSERVREFELKVRRDDDAVRSHTRFLTPADVAGTAMVIVDRPDQVDEQMLYVPALKRVTRISGRARSGSFLGSDFSFEDLEINNADDAKHTLQSETDTSWVIETVPGAGSSYGRILSSVRKSDYLPTKVEYFDRKGAPLKVLTVTATLESNGATYPKVSEMVHLKKGTRTLLEVHEYRVDVPMEELPDSLFSQTALERGG
ncbi:MAG: hypothetical protein CL927_20210 [Deltaproteobacteria bacterium]|nr:hypothetical protein [Deltaproteobacteria bacterium]HCH61406.1 hypothetical protein [Deltaproteobacteria bacterium]